VTNDVFVISIAWQWIIHFALAAIAGWPLSRIFRRAGLNPWPVAFLVVPILGFAITGSYLAFQRWPSIAPRVAPKPPRKARGERTVRAA
jgi:hypothetical protein